MSDQIKAVIFDLDGVITSNERAMKEVVDRISDELEIERDEVVEAYESINDLLDTDKLTLEEAAQQLSEKLKKDVELEHFEEGYAETPIDAEVLAIVDALKKLKIKTGIVTNNSVHRFEILDKKNKLAKHFDGIVVSAEYGKIKGEVGDTLLFSKIMSKLRVKAENCIYIDNRESYLETPEAMGMHTYHFDHDLRDVMALKIYLSGFNLMV